MLQILGGAYSPVSTYLFKIANLKSQQNFTPTTTKKVGQTMGGGREVWPYAKLFLFFFRTIP
jgi:hypothetical protein